VFILLFLFSFQNLSMGGPDEMGDDEDDVAESAPKGERLVNF
jgi:hypothetical protein